MTAYAYPKVLEDILNRRIPGIRFSVIDKGRAATDSGFVIMTLKDSLNKYNPDMVIVMTGFNDDKKLLPYGNIPVSEKIPLKTYKLAKILLNNIASKYRRARFSSYHTDDREIANKEEGTREAGTPGRAIDGESVYIEPAVDMRPEKDQMYAHPRITSWDSENYYEAEKKYKYAIERDPDDPLPYLELGRYYLTMRDFSKAENMYKRVINIDPRNHQVYFGLGWTYREQLKFKEAEEMYKRAIEVSPREKTSYFELGWCYRLTGDLDKAAETFRRITELDSGEGPAYFELGSIYLLKKDFNKAAEEFKKAIEINPRNDAVYMALVHCYEKLGNPVLAKEYSETAKKLRLGSYNLVTQRNYHKLKEILDEKGVKFVCMQYPARSLEPLKKIFLDKEGVIFVDNEKVFKEALKQASYDKYFIDMFAGDFGHCTREGNRLLAENIADTIIKRCFKK
ncbi:MAG: tetratricopeptide repeat protein [Candidatus Omnitrophota bacterium]|jgi:Tfp pilus assembly protein PilF